MGGGKPCATVRVHPYTVVHVLIMRHAVHGNNYYDHPVAENTTKKSSRKDGKRSC
jgi:hypothetical protein